MTTHQRKTVESSRRKARAYIVATTLAGLGIGFALGSETPTWIPAGFALPFTVLVHVSLAAGWFKFGRATEHLRQLRAESTELDREIKRFQHLPAEFGLCDECGEIHWNPSRPASEIN